jgi:hypothetical protein
MRTARKPNRRFDRTNLDTRIDIRRRLHLDHRNPLSCQDKAHPAGHPVNATHLQLPVTRSNHRNNRSRNQQHNLSRSRRE